MIRIFNHFISKWAVLLLIAESAVCFFSVYIGFDIRFLGSHPGRDDPHLDGLFHRSLVYTVVMIASLTAMGRYRKMMRDGLAGEAMTLSASFAMGLLIMSLIIYVWPELFLGRGAFAWALVLSFSAILATRWFFASLILDSVALKRRLLVLGAGERASLIARVPNRVREEFAILGFVQLPGEVPRVEESRVIHLDRPLAQFIQEQDVEELVIASDTGLETLPVADLLDCKMGGLQVVDMAGFFEKEMRMLLLEGTQPILWLILANGFSRGPVQEVLKRLLDVAGSLLLLALIWPVMLLTMIGIKLEEGWRAPVLYRQWRVGLDSKPFQLMKFRSMRTDAEKDGVPRWAAACDDRITRMGAFIRSSRIDELPQVFNVLVGEMSLVGPRPERPEFVAILSEKIPHYRERHRIRPGITGWAQVSYGYGASEEDAAEKLKYDLYYLKNRSLFLDLVILFQSVEVVLFGRAAHGPRF